MEELTGQPRNLMPNWTNIPKVSLVSNAQLLNQLLNTRLMPTISQLLVTKRRVELLYTITKGLTINVGQIINAKIKAMITQMKAT